MNEVCIICYATKCEHTLMTRPWLNLMHYSAITWWNQGKLRRICHNSWFPDRELKPRPFEYKTGMLTTQPLCVISFLAACITARKMM